jgi:hypothetical protein
MANKKGSVIILSLLLVVLLTGWIETIWVRSTTDIRSAQRWVSTLQAFHMAEASLDDTLVWLRAQASPPAGKNKFDPLGGKKSHGHGHGHYSAAIDPDDDNPDSYTDRFTIDATGESDGIVIQRRLLELIENTSFSRFAYFTNYEEFANGTAIWFNSRDHLTGPVYTNDQLHINGSPIFDGEVSSTASEIAYAHGGPPTDNPAFNGGLDLEAPAIQMPASLTKLRQAAAASGGMWLSGNTTISLQSNGTMRVTNNAKGWNNTQVSPPSNGAIFVNGGNVNVSGTLHGQLTIGSNQDITVTNSITYAQDPRTNPNSTDVLGLAAERNVVISKNAPNLLSIHASIMALNESFYFEDWSKTKKDTLTVLGGIIQVRRGAIASINTQTGEITKGYAKNYQYDNRLSDLVPPYYPTTNEYELKWWKQELLEE